MVLCNKWQNGEILQKGSQSSLPSSVNTCESWASANNMKLNASKTNEIRMNFSVRSHSYPSVLINDQTVGVVDYVNQLLGVIISNDLKRNLHVNDICKKASKWLYALRLLKRSRLSDSVLVNVYRTCVKLIHEYACEVWHNCIPAYLSEQIESIQKSALRITDLFRV